MLEIESGTDIASSLEAQEGLVVSLRNSHCLTVMVLECRAGCICYAAGNYV